MNRREFIRAGAGATLIGPSASSSSAAATSGAQIQVMVRERARIMATYTAEDHRRRLENVGRCERGVRKCLRKHLITSYLSGQCVYNLGEYPCRKPWNPDDWDEAELDRLREHGIRLIQLHEEWNDSQRMFGGHKLGPLNPEGFRRFVEMVHRRGMKLIVYASSGFFERTDPDSRDEWARQQDLVEICFRYARCSPASAGWRAYLLPRLTRILDEYGVDGLYNDLGYIPLAGNPRPATKDEVLAFEERNDCDGALTDLLALIYAEVKRRGGVVKLHYSATNCPRTSMKVYDYLWVGESVGNVDELREAVKNHAPYVVPCLDMSRARIEREDDLYLHAIPYMQFPLLLAGRPFTGERAVIPGVKYPDEKRCFWTRHCRAIWRQYQAHPDGPHSYGWWDSCPGRPEAKPTHALWLKRYLPLVEEGTWAWLEIGDSDLFKGALPAGVVASAFANRDLFLVLANYGSSSVTVQTSDAFVAVEAKGAAASTQWKLGPRSLAILSRC
ncbi:MAG: hypothetical protein JXQ73_30420 [Phycisphaerae bacterium]|nr:hypothetical protein [Phycisphaerae bacterium]